MTSGTPLLCIALITGCFRVKILPLPYLSFHDILGIMGYPERKSAQMYPDIVTNLELQFGALIPQMEVANENI